MALSARKEIDKKRALLDIANKAPLLPVEYREEFFGLFDECVVKAIELRLRKLPPPELEAALPQDRPRRPNPGSANRESTENIRKTRAGDALLFPRPRQGD